MKFAEYREIVAKKPLDPFWISRIIIRHISQRVSWLLSFTGISANTVTIISLMGGLVGSLVYCSRSSENLIIGTIGIFFWWILDHVDGELARFERLVKKKKANLAGEYLDLMVHRWVQPLYHMTLGIGLMRMTGEWWYVLVGILAGSNYYGFTRTQATSLILHTVMNGKTSIDDIHIMHIVKLGHITASTTYKIGIYKWIEIAKKIKNLFAFPGCLILLLVVVGIDIIRPGGIEFSSQGPIINATFIYLILQGLISIVQNIAGMWFISDELANIQLD